MGKMYQNYQIKHGFLNFAYLIDITTVFNELNTKIQDEDRLLIGYKSISNEIKIIARACK